MSQESSPEEVFPSEDISLCLKEVQTTYAIPLFTVTLSFVELSSNISSFFSVLIERKNKELRSSLPTVRKTKNNGESLETEEWY